MSPQELAEADYVVNTITDPEEMMAAMAVMDRVIFQYDPFKLIEQGHLTVKTKSGDMKPFVLNKAQRYVMNKIQEKWYAGLPVRLIILKARQLGISTLIEAIIYAVTGQKENLNSVIIADDKEGADYIFEMSKLFQEKLHSLYRPKEKKSNEKKLEFAGIHSQILIDTAKNPNAGRGSTLQLVHLSEYAFFKKVKDLMLGLSQAVPALPHTLIAKETTANGFNFFKKEWDAAKKGESDYIPIFIPWYWDEGYMMPVTEDFKIGDPSCGEIAIDELWLADLMAKEGIDCIEQRLNWRRWSIRNNCDGKVANFRQENPSTDYEAFVASGESYFDKTSLVNMLERVSKVYSFKADIVEYNNKFELRKSPDGMFTFYEDPEPGDKFFGDYTVAGDCSSGTGLDYSCLEACRRADGKTIATFHGKCDPDQMEEYAYLLGSYLNEALVAIENEKFGFAVNKGLSKRYGNLYKRENVVTADGTVTDKFGWETTSVTRPMMIANLGEDIRQNAKVIVNEQAIMECFTFVKNAETNKVEAEEGCNDDWVITMCINSAIRRLRPYEPPQDTYKNQYAEQTESKPNRGYGWKIK